MIIFTFATKHIQVGININSILTNRATPVLPIIQLLVVYPIGINKKFLPIICGYLAIVVYMITECQDLVYL